MTSSLSEPIRHHDAAEPVEPTSLVWARGLRKSYGDFEAVRGIDLDVRPGEAFGFLGPNGAGKSSTMRMVAAVSPPSGGELRILGMDPATQGPQIRARIGVCPQEDTLDTELSIRDNLVVYGRYFGLSRAEASARADELLRFVQLAEKAEGQGRGPLRRHEAAADHRALADQRARPAAARRADHGPRPAGPAPCCGTGCSGSSSEGVTLVLTTHYMDEAEQLCDRLVVMDKGRIVAEGSPLSLISEHSTREVAELRFGSASTRNAPSRWPASPSGSRCCPTGCCSTPTTARRPSPACTSSACDPVAVLVRRSTLEDVFLHLTGRTLVD